MKKQILISVILIITLKFTLEAQEVLTLQECYDMAISANALAEEQESYSEISEIKDNNLLKGWLPSVDLTGNLIYNSSVIDMGSSLGSLPVPGIADAISPLPHEQYKITIDINQVIYDGGSIKAARALEKAGLNVSRKQTETDLYKIRDQVNTCFFNLMLLIKQKRLTESYLELIDKQITSLQSAVANGIIIKSDIDVMTSEKISLEQQLAENSINYQSLLKMLSLLTGSEIDDSARFVIPDPEGDLSDKIDRYELQLFDLRKEQLSAGIKVIESSRMPKAFGYATFGYGNPPGNNFFKDEFAPYYILGIGFNWNIFDWNMARNEKKIISIQKGIIDNRKDDLSDNLQRMLLSKRAEIVNLKSLIDRDDELIALRKRITASAESQYNNGVITVTEYMNVLNSERQVIINSEIHKIDLARAKVEYLNVSGHNIDQAVQ